MIRQIASLSFVLFFTIAATPAISQTIVDNAATAPGGIQTVELSEQWRIGGEDEDFFFGTISRIHQDSADKIYILDGQLCQVHVISPDGDIITSLGNEGDGPGEVRGPGDFYISENGTVNILQGFPGKIVSIAADGTPAGTIHFSADGAKSPFVVMIRGLETSGGLYLGGIDMQFDPSGKSNQNYFLAYCKKDGSQVKQVAHKLHVIDYADFRMDEKEMDFIWGRMAANSSGQLFVCESRDEYSISVMNPDGTVSLVINRDYTAPKRTTKQTENAENVITAISKYHQAPLQGLSVEKSEPAIGGITLTNDGRIWVSANYNDSALPEGTWIMFDVFTSDGKLEKQVAFEGEYNRNRDAAYILPDGRLIVVTGALDAFLNQMGAAGENADEEAVLLEVICYEL